MYIANRRNISSLSILHKEINMSTRITGAVFAAFIAFLSVTLCGCERQNVTESVPMSSPIIENSDKSEIPEKSDPVTSTSTVTDSGLAIDFETPADKPTFLKGPDGKPIYQSDITYIYIKDTTAPNGRREADISELTEDNLDFVVCENFGYMQEPTGIRYNRFENPEMFESEFPYTYIGEEIENKNPIKRINVGDEVCGMTVSEIETSFVDFTRDTSVPFRNNSTSVKFKGEITLTGYLFVEDMTPDYPDTEGNVTFYPDGQSGALPITCLRAGENGAESSYYMGSGFYLDVGDIFLGTIYDGAFTPFHCDESLLDGITYGDRDIHVKITIDDYMSIDSDNRAVLKALERL